MAENQQGPGAELRSARESMGVSVREVADALNLPTHVIEALEADDFGRLPPSVFTRGYLRSYARLLELAPEAILARYPEVTEEVEVVTGEIPSVSIPARPSLQMLVTAAVAVVLLVVFLIWWFAGDGDEMPEPAPVQAAPAERPEATEPAEPVPEAEPATEPDPVSEPEAEPDTGTDVEIASESPPPSEEVPDDGAPEPMRETAGAEAEVVERPAVAELPEPVAADDEPDTAPAVEAEREAETEEPAVSQPVTPSRRERRITEFGDDVVVFEFSEDCWVEVKSPDGENLYSDLNRAGRTLVLTGRAPFQILIGYAPGVSLRFNDEPVPLERYSRNNVANLVVGER